LRNDAGTSRFDLSCSSERKYDEAVLGILLVDVVGKYLAKRASFKTIAELLRAIICSFN
jgi:hypothetical protein